MSDDSVVSQAEHANRTVQVCFDPDPLNPRTEYDNATTMVHWHRRYDLGDKRIERASADDLRRDQRHAGDPIVEIRPLYLMDHSGLSVSTAPYNCHWDSGQVGWVYITASQAAELGDPNPDELLRIIAGEVETYDRYLTGQVFGFVIVGADGETLESVWGFDDQYECMREGKLAAEVTRDPAVERAVEELQARATYAGGEL